ncbi:MAG: FtsX-like permease family protein [Caldimicrobium sp.]|nr:FtsX-like permease family protein [Caldimicrobium sp.]MCX7873886.1 FtsX-like permease family protein [Caldimicrobium sp.]MDW8094830.1 FtsX-like permease family protein [Caldimicrobium sp.]
MRKFLSWELWLALRYILSPKRERFTGVITTIALIGLILSVASLTVVNAVITGFKEVVKEKILSLNPHLSITLFSPERGREVIKIIEESISVKEIQSIQLVAVQQGLILKGGQPAGVILKAVDLESYSKERGFKKFSYELKELENNTLPIVVGVRLKDKLGIIPEERLSLLTIEGFYTPFGFFPKVIPLKVIGFFESGIYDYDLNLIFTSFNLFSERYQSRNLAIELKLRDPFKSNQHKETLVKTLGPLFPILDWQEWNRSLFSALKMEKIGLFVVLTLMVTVSLFTILSAMVMLVSEKKGDIAILMSLGATSKEILKLFFLAGFILSLIGVFGGLFVGILLILILSRYPVIKLPEEVYPVEYMPVSIQGLDLLLIGLVTILISLLACLYPAKKASSLNPAEILRRE